MSVARSSQSILGTLVPPPDYPALTRSRSVETDGSGKIVPVLYMRAGGHVDEHVLAPNPFHAFDGPEQRAELEARLKPLLR